jgi:hypothetical protein
MQEPKFNMETRKIETDEDKKVEGIYDPGKGNRTPGAWGNWLLSRLGLQRQVLQALQTKQMYQGMHSADTYEGVHERIVLAKRRAKNKVARRSRAINRHH